YDEARPVVGLQRRELPHHALAVVAQPGDQLLPGHLPERLGPLVDVHGHVSEAQRIFDGGVTAGTGERRQVALGGVDEVADDVAGLPVLARGGGVPPRARTAIRLNIDSISPRRTFSTRSLLVGSWKFQVGSLGAMAPPFACPRNRCDRTARDRSIITR